MRHRATHILLPDFLVAVRAWPALALLRLTGSRVILRVGMAPPVGRFYAGLWKWVVNAVVDRMICNSEFLVREVRERGVPASEARADSQYRRSAERGHLGLRAILVASSTSARSFPTRVSTS